MNYKIRIATPADVEEIINLCAEHAAYEQADYIREGKAEKLASFLFSKVPRFHCLIVENGRAILGYATYSFEFSTWDADLYTHMDCLYLRPEYRGSGIGEALIREIEEQSRLQKTDHIQWQTPTFNVRAIKFYHRIGAFSKEKVRFYLPTDNSSKP